SAILGQTYPSQPLPGRLSRMEVKAFGKASDNTDLGGRTDTLERYAQKTLHKNIDKQLAGTTGGDSRSGGGTGGGGAGSAMTKQALAMAANTIFGMAGLPIGIGALPGMMPNRTDRSIQEDQEASKPQEDPAVTSPNPPPKSARMQTKVGWCEMRLFGQT